MTGKGHVRKRRLSFDARAYHVVMGRPTNPLDSDACYLALAARDARFDGCFFTGVVSTGIYCRPICRVRTPRRENCRFFSHAAQAERAGFRPCLRCRPEMAPGTPAWSFTDAGDILVREALQWLEAPPTGSATPLSVAGLAGRLGVSDRHLRRLFEDKLGVSPVQYLQTHRLLAAKHLLADSRLPMTRVAQLSGFGSLRRLNAAFLAHYRLSPSQLRRGGPQALATPSPGISLRLGYRPPYDVAALLGFLHARAIAGMEQIDLPVSGCATLPGLRRTLAITAGAGPSRVGWFDVRFDEARHQVVVQVADSLAEALPTVIHRLRAMLDLDADPAATQAVLCHMPGPAGGFEGMRVPGCIDGFELAVRAVLGQQITIAAARTLTARLVGCLGDTLLLPAGIDAGALPARLFPSAQTLAQTPADTLGRLGIVRQRQAAILAIAQAVCEERLDLNSLADPQACVARLRELPGVGAWTAQYIAMRALRWPDAFPASDVALHKALGLAGPRAAAEANTLSQAWRPWRSYAVIRAWAAGPRAHPGITTSAAP